MELLIKVKAIAQSGDTFREENAKLILPFLQQALFLAKRYDAVVANPPYMGNKYLAPKLKAFLKEFYNKYEKDLFSAFIIGNLNLTRLGGQLGFMTPFVWMFISSYENLRTYLIENETITSLIQLEYSGFDGATVPICTFTLRKGHIDEFTGCYIRLSDFKGAENQAPKTLEAIQNRQCGWFYESQPNNFKKIPGSPIAYWLSEKLCDVFQNNPPLSDFAQTRKGLVTGCNKNYVRNWFEVSISNTSLNIALDRDESKHSTKKWFSYINGGGFSKWYGLKYSVINWENDGWLLRNTKHPKEKRIWATNFNLEYIFKPNINWGGISSKAFSARISIGGELFDAGGSACFCYENKDENRILPYALDQQNEILDLQLVLKYIF